MPNTETQNVIGEINEKFSLINNKITDIIRDIAELEESALDLLKRVIALEQADKKEPGCERE